MRSVLLFTALLLCGSGYAATNNPATDWFSRAGFGVFVHYLNELQNNAATLQSLGRSTTWDECVKEFDTERFASAMAEAGAGYVIFTTHQRTRFMIAPNATFDRITGYQFGEKAQDQPPDDWRERFVDQSPGDLNDDGSDIPF